MEPNLIVDLKVLVVDRIHLDDEEDKVEKTGTLKRAFDKTYWLWITIIVFGLVVQCLRSATMSMQREQAIGMRDV